MLSISRLGSVVILEMKDVARRNVLTAEMIADLHDAVRSAHDARAVVLRSAPECPVWSAGFDITALGPGIDPLLPGGALMNLFHAVRDCPAPVIASIHGSCWGGGTDLALRCDMLVADPSCTLAFTPARIGLPYDTDGLRNVLARAGLGLAIEMFTTAEPIGAERAHRHGLINHLVEPGALMAFSLDLAQRIAALAPLAVQSAKQQLRALAGAVTLPPGVLAQIDAARATALSSADYGEGVAAFHARRAPVFEGR